MNIAENIRQLAEEHTFDESFFMLVLEVMQHARTKRCIPIAQNEEDAQGLAADFIYALSQNHISGTIRTRGDLARECRRWLVARQAPEKQELWQLLSKSLRNLEAEGKVQRPEKQRKYHNNNRTQWALTRYADQTPKYNNMGSFIMSLPPLEQKGAHDRVLKPKEAEERVLRILEKVQGMIPMAELMDFISQSLPLFHLETSLDAPLGEQASNTRVESIEGAAQLGDQTLMIAEEAETIAEALWQAALRTNKGTGTALVSGLDVLYGYLLPKFFEHETVTLKTFGNTSTVSEIVQVFLDILRNHITTLCNHPHDEWLAAKLIEQIQTVLMQKKPKKETNTDLTVCMSGKGES